MKYTYEYLNNHIPLCTKKKISNTGVYRFLIPGVKSTFYSPDGEDPTYTDENGYHWLLVNTNLYSKLYRLFYDSSLESSNSSLT